MTDCTDCLSPQLLAALSGWVNNAIIILIAVLTPILTLMAALIYAVYRREQYVRAEMKELAEATARQLVALHSEIADLRGIVNQLNLDFEVDKAKREEHENA